MVILTSRVALIAASISLAAISNAPTVDGIAIPAIPRSEAVARHASVRRESPSFDSVIKTEGKMIKKKGEDNHPKNGEERYHRGRDASRITLETQDLDSLLDVLKRSPEQRFFHVRRHHRSSSSLRAPPRSFTARDEGNGTPGRIALEGSETRKKYGWLAFNSSNGDIDASEQATIWNLILVTCPQGSGFEKCAVFAMLVTSDKNRCITFTSDSTEPSRLHGDYCWTESMATEQAVVHRSQKFGYHPDTGHIEPLSSDSPSSQSSVPKRRENEEQVNLSFIPLEEQDVKQSNIDSSKSDSTSASSESTASTAETTTLTVTVTAESEPTASPADVSTASTTVTPSPTQTSTPLVVKVFGNSPSSPTDGVSVTAGTTSATTATATTTTPTSSVDGNAVASSIVAEYSSSVSSVASTTTTDSSSTPTDAARR